MLIMMAEELSSSVLDQKIYPSYMQKQKIPHFS